MGSTAHSPPPFRIYSIAECTFPPVASNARTFCDAFVKPISCNCWGHGAVSTHATTGVHSARLTHLELHLEPFLRGPGIRRRWRNSERTKSATQSKRTRERVCTNPSHSRATCPCTGTAQRCEHLLHHRGIEHSARWGRRGRRTSSRSSTCLSPRRTSRRCACTRACRSGCGSRTRWWWEGEEGEEGCGG